MGSDETIACRREGAVLWVSLSRAGSAEVFERLAAGLDDLRTSLLLDQETRVVVLADADGRAFDLGAGAEGEPGPSPSLAGPVAGIDVPVIAAVRGDAVGRGLELALACDLRVAARTSRFSLPHLAEGLVPADGGTQRLMRLVGGATALEMLLTSRQLDAAEALRIGLIQRVCAAGEVEAAAAALAREIAAKAPVALRYAKEAVRAGLDQTLAQGLRLEADLYCVLQTTADRTEGIRAFQERREPGFDGV
jgi:enoyl-CoA hydratase/carnithine racemase